MPAMAIILIRHGETPGNRDRIIQFPHIELSDRGLEQAAHVRLVPPVRAVDALARVAVDDVLPDGAQRREVHLLTLPLGLSSRL